MLKSVADVLTSAQLDVSDGERVPLARTYPMMTLHGGLTGALTFAGLAFFAFGSPPLTPAAAAAAAATVASLYASLRVSSIDRMKGTASGESLGAVGMIVAAASA